MSYTKEVRQKAKEIRNRLRRPPNAVYDPGINITRNSSGVRGGQIPASIPQEAPKPLQPPKVDPQVVLPLTFDRIIHTVTNHYGLAPESVKTPSRRRDISHARWIAVYLGAKLLKNRTLASMARELEKDHSSILHAKSEMTKYINHNKALQHVVNSLEEVVLAEHHN